jgi:hypothetical protein
MVLRGRTQAVGILAGAVAVETQAEVGTLMTAPFHGIREAAVVMVAVAAEFMQAVRNRIMDMAMGQAEQSELFGPETLVHSQAQIQVIYEQTVPRWFYHQISSSTYI